MRNRAFGVAVLACVGVSFGFWWVLWSGALGEWITVVVDDYLCAIVPMASGVLCLARWRRYRQEGRGWALLGASGLSWGAGGAVWTLYEVHLGIAVPFPSAADVGYLASVPLAVLALVGLSGSGPGAWRGVRTVMDGVLAAAALFFVSWATVLGPVVRGGEGTPLARVIALAYPTSDVLLTTMALLAVSRGCGGRRLALTLVSFGLGAVAISDSSFAWFTSQGAYATGNLFDTGYVAGYLMIALAAVRPAIPQRSEGTPAPFWAAVLLPYLPVLISAGLIVAWRYRHVPVDGVLFWDALLALALVLGRQLLNVHANLSLSRELADTVAALRSREAQLHHQAHHDGLTGLPNRDFFTEAAAQRLAQPDDEPITALLIDLDGFKAVNDVHGHHAGDLLLVEVARRLSAAVREGDTVARLGGDEFAVLLTTPSTVPHGNEIAARLLAALKTPITLGPTTVRIGASVGMAHSDRTSSLEQLLKHADAAMYQAKREGKGRLVAHTPTLRGMTT